MSSAQSIRRTPLDLVPAALVLGAGALAIALASNGGRQSTHKFWLAAVLAESVVAVLYRRRHPLIALAAVLATYVVFDYLALALLPLFLVLATVAASATKRLSFLAAAAATGVVVLVPALHGDALDAFHVLLPLGVIALGLFAGAVWRGDD